jgi:hypothetical protein
VLDPSYVDDIEELPMEELRSRRSECQELEVGLSYARRLAQGRLDIIGAELRRRTEGGEAIDVAALVEQLPEILSDRVRGPGLGRLPSLMVPGAEADFSSELDAVVNAGNLGALADRSDAEITGMLDGLHDYEQSVSARRRALHERLDALQAEITRRYRTGEASVETLLQ